MESEGDIELLNCNTCGRHFRSDVLLKHEPICLKNSKKKRKIFNSGKQRADGSDIPISKILKPGEIPKQDPKLAQAEAKTKNWREKHNLLVESFRAARDYAKAKSIGAPLPPPVAAVIDSSLVLCPYCQRRFNEESSKRHIPFCKEHQAKTAPRATNALTQKKPPITKTAPSKPKTEPPTQRTTVASSNGTRARTTPQSAPHTNSRDGDSVVLKTPVKTSVAPARSAVARTQPTPPAPPSAQSRTSTRGTSGIAKPSSLPRGPTLNYAKKPTGVPPTATTITAGVCHECGYAYPIASAKFCSECGVRRLTL